MGNCSAPKERQKKPNLVGSLLGGLTGFLTLGSRTTGAVYKELKKESFKEYKNKKNVDKRKEKEKKYQEKLKEWRQKAKKKRQERLKAKRAKLYSKTPHVQDMKRELKF